MEHINTVLFVAINSLANINPTINVVMILFAKYMPFLFIGLLLWFWFVDKDNYRSIALYSGYSAILGLLVNFIITLFYFHPRPFMEHLGALLIKHPAETSFPSDHTTFMLSIAFMLLYFKQTRIIGIIATFFGILSGFARVFCGLHFPFDIFGSIFVSLFASFIIFMLKGRFMRLNNLIMKSYLSILRFFFATLILSAFIFTYKAQSSNIPYNQLILKQIESKNTSDIKGFSFVVMGDNRDGDNILEKIIKDINSDDSIIFAINNGDLVPDGYEYQFRKYLSIIKKSKKPIISVIGNHEIPWYDGEKNYKEFFGKTYFSFTFSDSYFIVLDDSNKKGLGRKQMKWLVEKLKKSQKYKNRFVFMHVPLYDPRYGKYGQGHSLKSIKNARKLNDIFNKYNVTMLFCSHIHFYYRGIWHKTPFIITGGAGAPLKHFKDDGFYNYVKVTVSDNGVKYNVVRVK